MNTSLICYSCGSTLNDKHFIYQTQSGSDVSENKKLFKKLNIKRNCCRNILMTAYVDKKFLDFYKKNPTNLSTNS